MKKRIWKRLVSTVMALAMCLQLAPASALAAVSDLVGNTSVENTALLSALKEQYGEDAETYLALLDRWGLLDEDGNLITDETVLVDGKEYTLDELEALLDDPDTDLSRVPR